MYLLDLLRVIVSISFILTSINSWIRIESLGEQTGMDKVNDIIMTDNK